MTPKEIQRYRLELGLTVDEMAFALNLTEAELLAIENSQSELHKSARFQEAFDILEERVFGTYVGA